MITAERTRADAERVGRPLDKMKLSWGEPALITQAKLDRRCPRCGLTRKNDFDILMINGDLIGARCPNCEWSTGKDCNKP